jgi:threonine dehydrogenase-like Zn-dependent dehydrogenase
MCSSDRSWSSLMHCKYQIWAVAIFGVGGVGLCVIQVAVILEAYPIIAVDLNDEKLKFGAALVQQMKLMHLIAIPFRLFRK